MIEQIRKIIQNETCFIYKDENGMFRDDIIPNYDDKLSNKQIVNILEAVEPEFALEDMLREIYEDSIFEAENNILDILIENIDAEEGDLREAMQEVFYVGLPVDHFMNQDVYVNIMMDTGDGNYDYVLNSCYRQYDSNTDEKIHEKAALLWLAYQQGYGKAAFDRVMDEGIDKEGFLKSVRTEVLNLGSHMSTLTFLVKMSLRECIRINKMVKLQDRNGHFYDATKNPYCGYIVLDRKTNTGLYDPWYGAGSLFEIDLDKDVVLPVRFIRSALPDGEDGCSVANVYGMNYSIWKPTIKKICEPADHLL